MKAKGTEIEHFSISEIKFFEGESIPNPERMQIYDMIIYKELPDDKNEFPEREGIIVNFWDRHEREAFLSLIDFNKSNCPTPLKVSKNEEEFDYDDEYSPTITPRVPEKEKNKLDKRSTIKAFMDKKQSLKLSEHEFSVSIIGYFGIKKTRVIRMNDDFELLIYKKKNKIYHLYKMINISDINKLDQKKDKLTEISISLKSKKSKVKRFLFQNSEDASKFYGILNQVTSILETSKLSFSINISSEKHKAYDWLTNPQSSGRYTKKQIEKNKYVYNVINLSDHNDEQIIEIFVPDNTIEIKSKEVSIFKLIIFKGKSKKKINMKNVIFIEKELLDFAQSILILAQKKYRFLFSDVKTNSEFETLVFNSIIPHYSFSKTNQIEKIKLKIFTTTFNAGSSNPPEDLDLWLGKSKECDLIVIGMQECDTSLWFQAFQNYYLAEDSLALVGIVTMWEMLVCAFVSKPFKNYVTNLEVDRKATGLGKILGNKGGVGISFRIFDSSFCFISAHLAAKPDKMHIRKSNFFDIMKNIRFGHEKIESTAMFDHVFFLGDTNFRLDRDFFEAVELIEKNDYMQMFPDDQYQIAKFKDNFMTIFDESAINFKPTYRRNRNDSGYSNKKNQCPSWTDRVFYKARPNNSHRAIEYNSAEFFYSSDHRPVYLTSETFIHPPYFDLKNLMEDNFENETIIRIKDLEISYELEEREKLNEKEGILPVQHKIQIEFIGKFLTRKFTSLVMDVKMLNDKFEISEQNLPLLTCFVTETSILKESTLLLILSSNECVIGYSDISLKDINNSDSTINFSSSIYFYAKKIESIIGKIKLEST